MGWVETAQYQMDRTSAMPTGTLQDITSTKKIKIKLTQRYSTGIGTYVCRQDCGSGPFSAGSGSSKSEF